MRVAIQPFLSWVGTTYTAICGEYKTFLHHKNNFTIWSHSVWECGWHSNETLQVRVPVYGILRPPVWLIYIGERELCRGEPDVKFLPGQSKTIWKGDDFYAATGRCRIAGIRNGLWLDDGTLLAAWRRSGCRLDATIRSSATPMQTTCAFGILIGSILDTD